MTAAQLRAATLPQLEARKAELLAIRQFSSHAERDKARRELRAVEDRIAEEQPHDPLHAAMGDLAFHLRMLRRYGR